MNLVSLVFSHLKSFKSSNLHIKDDWAIIENKETWIVPVDCRSNISLPDIFQRIDPNCNSMVLAIVGSDSSIVYYKIGKL